MINKVEKNEKKKYLNIILTFSVSFFPFSVKFSSQKFNKGIKKYVQFVVGIVLLYSIQYDVKT